MNKILYIFIGILCLTACQSEETAPTSGQGTLVLDLYRGAIPSVQSRAVAEGLAVKFLNPDGTEYRAYAAGEIPAKIVLQADVKYKIQVYSDNQTTWQTANGGKGEACYWGETSVKVSEDDTKYVTYAVPMSNYAVTMTLPEMFSDLFKSYTFSLSSSDRNVTLREGEKTYFAVPDAFTYQLSATNLDNKYSSHTAIEYPEVKAGKLYNIKYVYGTTLNTGGIDIEITDNTEHEDINIGI